jgi:hypothetical protein
VLGRPPSYLLFDNNRNMTVLLKGSSVIAQPSLRGVYRQRVSKSLAPCGNARQNQPLPRQCRGFSGDGFFVIWVEIV